MAASAANGRRRLLVAGAASLLAAAWLPCARAQAPARSVLVLVDGGTRLAALALDDLQPRQELALPGGPWRRLFVQGDGHALLVSDDGAVARVAPQARALLAHRPGEGMLVDAALGDGGRLLLLARRAPGRLTLLDATTLEPLKHWPLATVDGRIGTAGAEVHDAPARRSFVVAPADLPELWEISYDPRAEDQYEGLVHDFRMGEGVPVRGHLHARRTRLPQPLCELALDDAGLLVVGAAAGQPLQGYNLDARRRAGQWHIEGAPRPRAGSWLRRDGSLWLALPDAARPLVHWLHADGRTAPALALPAPAQWLRAAPAGPWLWAGVDGTLLRIDLDSGAVARVGVPGTVLALQMLPGGRQALLLTDDAVHRLDLDSRSSMMRSALRQPLSMALAGPPG